MTIEQTIQNALDGGYMPFKFIKGAEIQILKLENHFIAYTVQVDDEYSGRKRAVSVGKMQINDMLLDPLFWQALGKALEWPEPVCDCCGATWHYRWERMIEHLAKGGTIESYFESL